MSRPTRTGIEKKVTRYTYEDIKEPRTPETGHTSLLPAEEQVVTLAMDNGWSKALEVGKLADDERPVVVDMDPAIDPVLFWSGKRNRRDVPVLPLQRNEVVSESRMAQIIERARRAAAEKSGTAQQQHLFAGLEKTLRDGDRTRRVEFYTHEEGWKNKLICGDSLQVMESLLHYEGLRGKVQTIYFDPPYGVSYDSNFQQRVDATTNADSDAGDDVLTIKAFNDTWVTGIHSYLSHLYERAYLFRELLSEQGSVFIQIGDENAHLVRQILDEVFGAGSFLAEIMFVKTSGRAGGGLDSVFDRLLWYCRNPQQVKYRQLYMRRPEHTLREQYTLVELADGSVRRLSEDERSGAAPLPQGARRFMPGDLSSQGESSEGRKPYVFAGTPYELPPNTHWKTNNPLGLDGLASKNRLFPVGKRLRYKRYDSDFPWAPFTNVWDDTVVSGFAAPKLYAVQTSPKVVERCLLMASDPGDIVFDPSCGSGTTAASAEKLGRRWITCDTSRVAINVARTRLLGGTYDHFRLAGSDPTSGFIYRKAQRITLRSLAYDLEPEAVDLVDQPEIDGAAIRMSGPFEVLSIGRYSLEDWKGYLLTEGTLENYISVVCRLYRRDAAAQGGGGLVHAIAEDERGAIAISVGPLTGRVTGKQIHEAAEDAIASGILEVHVLGWAFEANVGEVKSQLERRGKVKVELIMIRPDTLAEGLKANQPEALFSPLALPDIAVETVKNGQDQQVSVSLGGVALFDRKRRTTEYKQADSGYISAWYLDEDYDGDCFVDCQMFFDFKKAPNIKVALRAEVDPDEFTLKLKSEPFPVRSYRRIAVKVVDVYGNESTVVRDLE